MIVVRADSAFYAGAFIGAARRAGAHFSVTVRMDPKVRRAITTIGEDAWVPVKYPNAVFDEQTGTWISDAEIAEVPYTAFASHRAHRTDGRLIVRRVRRLNPKAIPQGQHELFATYRYHATFTEGPFPLTQAESHHRGHAVIEQVFADLIDGPLAHLPSAAFPANAAWLQLAVTVHALTRTLGTLASARHAHGATIGTGLICVAGRPARSQRDHITWHLPQALPWRDAFTATHRPPPTLVA